MEIHQQPAHNRPFVRALTPTLRHSYCRSTIHTDFETYFIKAAITSYDDSIASGGEGKSRAEGRDYVMQNGDVAEFFSHKSTR